MRLHLRGGPVRRGGQPFLDIAMDSLYTEENHPRVLDEEAESAPGPGCLRPDRHDGFRVKLAGAPPCPALPGKRHRDLLRLLRAEGQLTVREVAAHFKISVDTARRDLDLLARQGLLSRAYGGAIATEKPVSEGRNPMAPVSGHSFDETRLAQLLDQLIKDGETLLLNGGSATRLCVGALGRRNLRMVTNSLDLPFESVTAADVYVLGGKCRPNARTTAGPLTISGLNINADSALIGVEGITVHEGLTAGCPENALMASEMIAAAQRTIVVADSSRLGKKAFARIGPVESMQVLITDSAPPADLASALREARVEVIIAAAQEAPSPFCRD